MLGDLLVARSWTVVPGGIVGGLMDFFNSVLNKALQFLLGGKPVDNDLNVGPEHDFGNLQMIGQVGSKSCTSNSCHQFKLR